MRRRNLLLLFSAARLVLLALALFGHGSIHAFAGLMLVLALAGYAVWAWRRRTYELPDGLHLYSVALARSVADAPKRQSEFMAPLHHLTVQNPLLTVHLVERAADAGGVTLYTFLVGIPDAYADAGRAALMNAYNGPGCIVRSVPMEESGLYAIAYETIEQERFEQEAAELARLERRDARGGASHGFCRLLDGFYRHVDDQSVAESVAPVEETR